MRVCYIPSMLIECAGPKIRLVQPHSFAGLMTLYAANHASLRQLLGDLRSLPSTLASHSASDLSISLEVGERSCYTTNLRMTYSLKVGGHLESSPDLDIRVYHDARLAEAVSCGAQPKLVRPDRVAFPFKSEMSRRWHLNILLRKWLEHCLEHRHRFDSVQARPAGSH